jgi:hypothetical protein
MNYKCDNIGNILQFDNITLYENSPLNPIVIFMSYKIWAICEKFVYFSLHLIILTIFRSYRDM